MLFRSEEKNQKMRSQYRKKIISTTKEEIIEAALKLKDQPHSSFAIINPNLEKQASEEGFQIRRI